MLMKEIDSYNERSLELQRELITPIPELDNNDITTSLMITSKNRNLLETF